MSTKEVLVLLSALSTQIKTIEANNEQKSERWEYKRILKNQQWDW